MRARRAVRADRRRRPLRRADGRAPRAVERRDLVEIGPSRGRSRGRYEYHLDFPGDALDPGCDYERWGGGSERTPSRPSTRTSRPSPPPGEARAPVLALLRLQRLQQPARGRLGDDPARLRRRDAREALERRSRRRSATARTRAPSAPTGATTSWSSSTARTRSCTRPRARTRTSSRRRSTSAARPRPGSAATTRAARTRAPPDVRDDPERPAAAQTAFPWIAFEGRWGELQRAFFNGPTGPNLKTQWTEPIAWSEGWRDRGYAVPTGRRLGTSATDFFCSAVAKGSRGLIRLAAATLRRRCSCSRCCSRSSSLRSPVRPGGPRRRSASRTAAAGGRSSRPRRACTSGARGSVPGYRARPDPAVVRDLARTGGASSAGSGCGVDTTGESAGALVIVIVVIGTMLTLLGFAFVQAATSCAPRLDAGSSTGALDAYRDAFAQDRPARRRPRASPPCIWVVLSMTVFLIPVAIWIAVRWALLAQVVVLEERGRSGRGPPPQRRARPWALADGRLARRRRRGARARGRPAARGPADHRHRLAARTPAEPRRRGRLRARDAVRRAHDHVRVLRRATRHELEPEEEPDELPRSFRLFQPDTVEGT